MSQISSLSLQYVKVPIIAFAAGVEYDPTGDDVVMAFMTDGDQPTSGDWKTATWETASGAGETVIYLARALVGPAGVITLTAGEYRVWVKITDSPEIPVLVSDILIVV